MAPKPPAQTYDRAADGHVAPLEDASRALAGQRPGEDDVGDQAGRTSGAAGVAQEGDASSILESISDGFYVLDRAGRFTLFNDQCERYFGLRRTDVIGRPYLDVFPKARGTAFHRTLAEAYRTGQPQRIEDRSPVTGVPILLRAFPSAHGLTVVFTDVSERHRADEALRQSENRYRTLFESLDEGFCVIEMLYDDAGHPVDYRFLEANSAFERQTGLVDAVGKTIRSFVPNHEAHWFDVYDRVARTGESIRFEQAAESLGGSWYEALAFPFGEPGQRQVGVLFGEVSERKRTQDALRRSEARLSMALGIAGIGTFEIDLATDATTVNERGREIFGWPSEGPFTFDKVRESFHPVDRRWVVRALDLARMPDGPREFEIEHRIVRPDGDERWIRVRGRVIFEGEEADRGAIRCLGTFLDVTERRRSESELRAAKERLETRVAERTRELEEAVRELEGFNYTVAHDLRAPLRAIVSTSAILIDEHGESLESEARGLLERQRGNANRLARLIDDLLRLARLARAPVHRQPLDLTATVRAVVDAELDLRPSNVRVEVQESMLGDGDPALVRLLFHNLIGNALKFSPGGGTVRVLQEGGVIRVSDEGVGFEMKYAPKVFLPFERLVTEAEYEGTGIGLANVDRIVRRHGGRIWVESEPGRGTTFFFTLGDDAVRAPRP